jgi:DNA modification methylase
MPDVERLPGSVVLLQCDTRSLALPDDSVDLIVTSPPYWALRDYEDDGVAYDGQIGAEASPRLYIESLIDATREWARVLKPSGSMFVNLGDKYAGSDSPNNNGTGSTTLAGTPSIRDRDLARIPRARRSFDDVRDKSLIGLPWRYAIGCIDRLGLTLRSEIIWSKVNCLPESVLDRVKRSHEQWFHLTKSPRYYAATDAIREPYAGDGTVTEKRYRLLQRNTGRALAGITNTAHQRSIARGDGGPDAPNPLGKLPGSVWEVASEPLLVPAHLNLTDHYAAFPMEWPKRFTAGWSPSGICTRCGEGRRLRVESERVIGGQHNGRVTMVPNKPDGRAGIRGETKRHVIGHICRCPNVDAPTRRAVVLDPFGGSGTTALVAAAMNRVGISVDMSGDYGKLAKWRTEDPVEIAKALDVLRPPAQIEGQRDLMDELRDLDAIAAYDAGEPVRGE